MNITLTKDQAGELDYGALVVGVWKDKLTPEAEALDQLSGGEVSRWVKEGDIHTCLGKKCVIPGFPGVKAKRVCFVGLGRSNEASLDKYAKALLIGAEAIYFADSAAFLTSSWLADGLNEKTAMLTGRLLRAAWSRAKSYKTHPIAWRGPAQVALQVGEITPALTQALADGALIGEAKLYASQLADMPANLCTPVFMAEEVRRIGAEQGLEVDIFEQDRLKAEGLNCILAVASGSAQPPVMAVLKYQGGQTDDKPLVLIGKGLTFDAGGISLKPAKGMDEMKYDMSGAAAMLAVISAAAQMKLPLNITAVIGCVENLPDGAAVKPGDVITSYSGKTIEVLNTDAEGRLVLCDLIGYAVKNLNPACLIDAATLTGACVVALGNDISGLFTNCERMSQALKAAGQDSLDPVWPMPLGANFHRALKSPFADLANIGATPGGGACTAAAFLEEFTEQLPWAHLDIAGTAWKSGKDKGSTGRPVPLLCQYLKNLSQ